MKRIAIIANHGIGFHKPYAHAYALAKELKKQLEVKTGREWLVTRFFKQVPEGTPIGEISHCAARVSPAVEPSDDVIVDVFEPSWSEMTKGFIEKRTLLGAVKGALRSISTSYRTPNRKTFVETAMLLLYAMIGAVTLFAPLVAASYLVLTFLVGYNIFGFLAILLTLMLAGNPFARGFLILMGAPAVIKDFQAHYKRNKGVFLPVRAMHAYLEAYPAQQRAYSWATSIHGFGLAYLGGLLSFPTALYAYWAHVKWSGAPFTMLDLLVAAVAVSGPSVVRLLGAGIEKAFGPLEDIYTFCAFTIKGGCIDRRDAVVTRSAQVVMEVLQTIDLETGERYYEELHFFGHSMGSYLAMRSLAKLYDAVAAGALSLADLGRVKSLTTYGAAVEKILAFFGLDAILTDVDEATAMLVELEQLESGKIRWMNLYYLTDIVADYIASCRPHCENIELAFPATLWSHGHYLKDSKFWAAVLPIQLGICPAPQPAGGRVSFSDRVIEFMGRLDTAPVFSNKPTRGGWMRGWSLVASLIGGLWCMGHIAQPAGLLLGISLPFATIVAVQLSDSEKK